MFDKVLGFVKQYHMLEEEDKVVVGVSGGADSVGLLLILLELKKLYHLELYVVHVNHGYRGAEADQDQEFVEALCNEYNISFAVKKVDMASYAKENGYSLEEAGRILRYEAFEEARTRYHATKVAVAHNKNDQAETVLMNLTRGTGMRGLSGIGPKRGDIIRPFLCVTRTEIESYLEQRGVGYRVDSSNLTDDFTRNKVRRNVIPLLEEVNEQAITHIYQVAEQMREMEQYLDFVTKQTFDRIVHVENGQYCLNVEQLEKENPVIGKRILQMCIREMVNSLKDIEAKHILSVYNLLFKSVGKEVHLPYELHAKREYEQIVFYKKCKESPKKSSVFIEVEEETEYELPGMGMKISFTIRNYEKSRGIPKNRYTKWFDYDRITTTIIIRNRRQGDYLSINNKGNAKTIKALFIDNKIPREKRDMIPLLCDGSHVMWIIGDRISEAYKVTDQTKKILEVKVMEV